MTNPCIEFREVCSNHPPIRPDSALTKSGMNKDPDPTVSTETADATPMIKPAMARTPNQPLVSPCSRSVHLVAAILFFRSGRIDRVSLRRIRTNSSGVTTLPVSVSQVRSIVGFVPSVMTYTVLVSWMRDSTFPVVALNRGRRTRPQGVNMVCSFMNSSSPTSPKTRCSGLLMLSKTAARIAKPLLPNSASRRSKT